MPVVFPKVVASDLDGTLLRSDGSLDERSRRALADIEQAGVVVVLCTARPTRWMKPVAQATGHRGVAICANGGVLWDLQSESIIQTRPFAPQAARDVVTLLKAAIPDGAWAVERPDGIAHEPAYRPRSPVQADTVIDTIEALVAEPAVKLMLRHDRLSADALLRCAREILGGLAELSHSNSTDGLLEISAAGVSKASALAALCAERGIRSREVIAFGDMPNDLPMLQWAGHAVAVANAHPDVLAAADEVTADNNDAGVARVLERLLAAG